MRIKLSFRCESHSLSDASYAFFQTRVALSFTCESHFRSDASHTFFQMRVARSNRCESHFPSHASHTFIEMRVTLSFRCESHFFFFFFRCESNVLSDASQTFWKWRGGWCEGKEETGVKVRRRLVWEWGGNWSISGYLQVTIRTLKGMQACSTLVCLSNSA